MTSGDDVLGGLRERLRDEDLAPGTVVGEYRVEGKLGEGGMASVFAAVHPVLGKRAAIKVISRRLCADLHAVERFVQEARAVHQIGHPNIVDTFGFGTLPDGRAYFLMEWLDGETLSALEQRGPVPLELALEVLSQIADALAAAHEHGVVHRDVKPDNVFVAERGGRPQVKLLDFGIAKLAAADVTVPRTRSGAAMGTAGYVSPEQARGKPVDARTDVYALGALAFELILGRLPFEGESAVDILAQHLAAPPPVPSSLWPEIPEPLDRLLLGMLEKEVDRRVSLDEVRRVVASLRGQALPSPRRSRARRRWVVPALTLGVVSAAAMVLFVVEQPSTRPRVVAPVATAPASPAPPSRAAASPTTAAPATRPTAAPPSPPTVLRVHADAPDALVEVDGHALPAGSSTISLTAGGAHRLAVSARGRQRDERTVDVPPGATLDVEVHLAPLRTRPPATPRHRGQGDYTLNPFD